MSMAVVECPSADTQTGGRRQRCSEAMRRGARAHEQGRFSFYDPAYRTTCALGALAVGLIGREVIERGAVGNFRALVALQTGVDLSRVVACPVSGQRGQLDTTIMGLNDVAAWSREQIADWLESLGL